MILRLHECFPSVDPHCENGVLTALRLCLTEVTIHRADFVIKDDAKHASDNTHGDGRLWIILARANNHTVVFVKSLPGIMLDCSELHAMPRHFKSFDKVWGFAGMRTDSIISTTKNVGHARVCRHVAMYEVYAAHFDYV